MNMRTAEEIKKGLKCCIAQRDGRCEEYVACVCCPYFSENPSAEDILAYIQQLERENKDLLEERELNEHLRDKVQQLERERDAAVEDLKTLAEYVDRNVVCSVCSHEKEICGICEFEWCGVKEKNNG